MSGLQDSQEASTPLLYDIDNTPKYIYWEISPPLNSIDLHQSACLCFDTVEWVRHGCCIRETNSQLSKAVYPNQRQITRTKISGLAWLNRDRWCIDRSLGWAFFCLFPFLMPLQGGKSFSFSQPRSYHNIIGDWGWGEVEKRVEA